MFGRTVRELEQEIRTTELRVIEHDWRLQSGWQRLRHEAGRATALRAAAAAGLVALGWLLHRPRGRKREERPRRGRARRILALPFVLQRALPLLLPLAQPLMHRRVALSLGALGVRGLPAREPPPLATVGALDLQRYAGLWHEIARLPRRAERRCERDVLAFYRPHAGGLIAVNACTDRSGRRHEKAALLRVPDAHEPGRLEASFAPPWLRWLPAAWTDYCVMYVDPDYEVALVGTPDRDGLWLLAREPALPDNVRQGLLELAARHGFDTSRVRSTPQEGA